ncbi:Translation machinery-associated protein 16 [Anthophora plagiata]
MSTAMRKEYRKAQKVMHPNSRKSIAIAKRAKKILNRQKMKTHGFIKQNLVAERMMWIREHMVPDVCPYTPELTARLLEAYVARNDEEMEQINIKRSVGGKRIRQHASREDVIRMTKERDLQEYNTCGIEIPDILDEQYCTALKKWSGELNYLPYFKFRRFGKKHLQEVLQKMEKQSKEDIKKDVQSEISEKPENPSEEIRPEDNSLSESVDSTEDNVPARSSMNLE